MLVFVKLGGSLITDKRVENSFREAVVVRLARELHAALTANPNLRILVGHGSGSFGPFCRFPLWHNKRGSVARRVARFCERCPVRPETHLCGPNVFPIIWASRFGQFTFPL